MSKFAEGQQIKAIYFADRPEILAGTCTCTEITVTMELGQMAPVPWFSVWRNDEVVSKWNAAVVVGVAYE